MIPGSVIDWFWFVNSLISCHPNCIGRWTIETGILNGDDQYDAWVINALVLNLTQALLFSNSKGCANIIIRLGRYHHICSCPCCSSKILAMIHYLLPFNENSTSIWGCPIICWMSWPLKSDIITQNAASCLSQYHVCYKILETDRLRILLK